MKGVNGARWMIYGAYGYTGALVTEQALRKGCRPVLAGRNERKLRAIAERYDCEWRAFDLNDPGEVRKNIHDMTAVLHCAGPFSHTARPMVDACLVEGVHYTDVTGEIAVLEELFSLNEQAQSAGIAIVPGTGFDVVPTDCLALQLSIEHPDATRLVLAFSSDLKQSPGTWKSTLEGAATGGKVRKDSAIITVPQGWKTRVIDYGGMPRLSATIPWGDVSTAFHTTGIADIEFYISASRFTVWSLKFGNVIAPLLNIAPLQNLLKTLAGLFVKGPSPAENATSQAVVFGEITNPDGTVHTGTLGTPEPYAFTAISALEAVLHVIGGGVPPGVHTPAKAFGKGFVDEVLAEMGFRQNA